ncbi:MAG: DUF2470 domain-containing protein [Pseudomonadota bacterium]
MPTLRPCLFVRRQTVARILRRCNNLGMDHAKHLLRTARFGALAVLEEDGAPSLGRVGLATECSGAPVFPLSELSGRPARLAADRRASLLIGEACDGDGLAGARLTLTGTAERLEGEAHDRARARYLARYPDASYVDFKDFSLWRLSISRARWVAGYGSVHTLSSDDLLTPFDEWDAWHTMEPGAVAHMNEDHADATRLYATALCGSPDGDWRITGLDPDGIDMAMDNNYQRFTYDAPLSSTKALRPALVKLVGKARARTRSGE